MMGFCFLRGGPAADLATMCGNFGLLFLACQSPTNAFPGKKVRWFEDIIVEQVEKTRIRGSQAAGLSVVTLSMPEQEEGQQQQQEGVDAAGKQNEENARSVVRVRVVPGKRERLSRCLLDSFRHKVSSATRQRAMDGILSCIGHSRFATSSENLESELHPHEWVPFRRQGLWQFDRSTGRYTKKENATVGVHITHNGDFISFQTASGVLTNEEVGVFCELVLHQPNDVRSDSAKIAGMMDLLHVQGKWGAAARLAYQRVMVCRATDASSTNILSKGATSLAPGPEVWRLWEEQFEAAWVNHIDDVIVPEPHPSSVGKFRYKISSQGVKKFEASLLRSFTSAPPTTLQLMRMCTVKATFKRMVYQLKGFIHHTVRGFLRGDLYSALSEFLHKAQGSFGIQAHSPSEPGVVVVGSKGQPMAVAFQQGLPMVLFASESAALELALMEGGSSSSRELTRLDLDSDGEVMRVGVPSDLIDGRYSPEAWPRGQASPDPSAAAISVVRGVLEVRCYSVIKLLEYTTSELRGRCMTINAPPQLASPSNRSSLLGSIGEDDDEEEEEDLAAEVKHDEELGVAKMELESEHPPTATKAEATTRAAVDSSQPGTLAKISSALTASYNNVMTHIQELSKGQGLATDDKGFVSDLVAKDIKDIARVIEQINLQFYGGSSGVRPTTVLAADSVCDELIKRAEARATGTGTTDGYDLVVAGEEVSLWIAQQFVADVKVFLPGLRVIAVEANRLLSLGEPMGRGVYFSGDLGGIDKYTLKGACCLLISQSGQTYPTLHSVRVLSPVLGKKLWMLVGSEGTQMECTLRKIYRSNGWDYGRNRVMLNMSGYRPVEPTSVAIIAAYHTLSVLLQRMLRAAGRTTTAPASSEPPSSPSPSSPAPPKPATSITPITSHCAEDMQALLTKTLVSDAEAITGATRTGAALASPVNGSIIKEGERLGAHVRETWTVQMLVAAYIIITVVLGIPLASLVINILVLMSGRDGIGHFSPLTAGSRGMNALAGCLMAVVSLFDALLYIYMGKLLTWLIRYIQGRPVAARMGKRTIVIVDYPCIHQMAETFVTKLFALSYGFSTVDVHSGAGVADFCHRYSHRVARGLLLMVGRPDGRMAALTSSEEAVLLASTQAALISNPDYKRMGSGNAPELLGVGHNPYNNPFLEHSIVLPSDARPKSLLEFLYHKHLELRDKGAEARGMKRMDQLKDLVDLWRQQTCMKGGSNGGHHVVGEKEGEQGAGGGTTTGEEVWPEDNFNPHKITAFMEGLSAREQELVADQRFVEYFFESRVASIERYMTLCTLFHVMARSAQPLLYWAWDIAFSQSSLRVATTAAPVVAKLTERADLETGPQEPSKGGEIHMALNTFAAAHVGHHVAF